MKFQGRSMYLTQHEVEQIYWMCDERNSPAFDSLKKKMLCEYQSDETQDRWTNILVEREKKRRVKWDKFKERHNL